MADRPFPSIRSDEASLTLIAYVYPGWHPSPFRPGVNEWTLLNRFKPYFEGHLPPPRPASGAYDDSSRDAVAWQLDTASSFSIQGFTYFLYFGLAGYVLDRPLWNAIEISRANPKVQISATWCMRLPHDAFPIRPRSRQQQECRVPASSQPLSSGDTLPLELRPLNRLSIADLELLFGHCADNLSPASLIRAFAGHK